MKIVRGVNDIVPEGTVFQISYLSSSFDFITKTGKLLVYYCNFSFSKFYKTNISRYVSLVYALKVSSIKTIY